MTSQIAGVHFGPRQAQAHFTNYRDRQTFLQRDGVGNELVGRPGFEVESAKEFRRKIRDVLGDDGLRLCLDRCGDDVFVVWIRQSERFGQKLDKIIDHRLGKGLCHCRNSLACTYVTVVVAPLLVQFGQCPLRLVQNSLGSAQPEKFGFRQAQKQNATPDADQRTGVNEGGVSIGKHGWGVRSDRHRLRPDHQVPDLVQHPA